MERCQGLPRTNILLFTVAHNRFAILGLVTDCRFNGCWPTQQRASHRLGRGFRRPSELPVSKWWLEAAQQPANAVLFSRCEFLSKVGLPRDNVLAKASCNITLK